MSERNETTQAQQEKTRKSGWKQCTSAEARRALADWRKSGLPLATFARKHAIRENRLRWWRGRLGGATSAAAAKPPQREQRLVPAVLAAPLLSLSTAAVAIRVPGGAVLEISDVRAVPPEWVGILLAAAAKASSR